jgi:hypothetical protein
MPVIKIDPSKDHNVPYDTEDEVAPTLLDQMAIAGNTAELQAALGVSLEVDEVTADREESLLREVIEKRKLDNLKAPTTAFAAAAFLREYGSQLALDAASVRSAVTHKLMEIANCGDPKYELKALELLGKHSDVGLFTTRSEVTINYKNPEDLENAIKERVKRLLNADVIDVTPDSEAFDATFGVIEDEDENVEEDTESDSE